MQWRSARRRRRCGAVAAGAAVLILLPGLGLTGLTPASAAAPQTRVRLLQANIGNINVAPGACNDQAFKLCLAPVEQRVLAQLAELDPQVVLLQETLPALLCAPPTRPGAFGTEPSSLSLQNPQHLCNPSNAGAADDQIDRLLPPDRWDTRCNEPFIDPADPERVIPPWDCVGVRKDLGRIATYRTLLGTEPGAVEGEPCDNGFTMNVATLELTTAEMAGRPLQVTSAHPDSGSARAGCRAEKLSRLFAALGGAAPPVPTVVSGDMNLDPYRAPDASTDVMDRFISADGSTPYGYRSGIAEADPPPFSSNICGASQEDPTGLVLDGAQPPAGPCASTLDHVAATADVNGDCTTLNGAARLDGGGGTDHKGIFCELVLAGAGAAPAGGSPSATPGRAAATPAPSAVATPPGRLPAGQGASRVSARTSLPATGGLPLAYGVVVVGLAMLLWRRHGVRPGTGRPRR